MPLLALSDDVDARTLAEWHYAYRTETLCVDLKCLSAEHWLLNLGKSFDADVEVEVLDASNTESYSGVWADVQIQRCDRIVLKGALGAVTMSDTCLFIEAETGKECREDLMLIPAGARDGDNIRQTSRFEDDCDIWREDIQREEVQRFANFLLALTAGTGAAVLTAVLQRNDLRAFSSLLGHTYQVVVSHQGHVSVTHDVEQV